MKNKITSILERHSAKTSALHRDFHNAAGIQHFTINTSKQVQSFMVDLLDIAATNEMFIALDYDDLPDFMQPTDYSISATHNNVIYFIMPKGITNQFVNWLSPGAWTIYMMNQSDTSIAELESCQNLDQLPASKHCVMAKAHFDMSDLDLFVC